MTTSTSTSLASLRDRLRAARAVPADGGACAIPGDLADGLLRLLDVLADDRELRTEIMMVVGSRFTATETLELMDRLADRASA